jgi:integrase
MAKPKEVLAETTNKEYARIINAISTAGYKDDDIDSLKAYFDFEGDLNGKKKVKYSIASKRININACINKHKSNVPYCDTLRKWMLELKNEHDTIKSEQKMNDKQKAKHIEWDELLKICIPQINNEKNRLDERILIGLYMQLEPVRNDYTHLKLYTEDPKLTTGTYFVINDEIKQVVITQHKTACNPKIGTIRQNLPDRLAEMIVMWFKDDSVLFPITENNMCIRVKKLFTRITGKPMTICALRHSRDTFLYKDSPMPKEANRIAKLMGHTSATAQQYRFAPEEKD